MDELKKDEHKADHKHTQGTPNSEPGTDHKKNDDMKKAEDSK